MANCAGLANCSSSAVSRTFSICSHLRSARSGGSNIQELEFKLWSGLLAALNVSVHESGLTTPGSSGLFSIGMFGSIVGNFMLLGVSFSIVRLPTACLPLTKALDVLRDAFASTGYVYKYVRLQMQENVQRRSKECHYKKRNHKSIRLVLGSHGCFLETETWNLNIQLPLGWERHTACK